MFQTFVILTHARSGSSLLSDMLRRNGFGAPEEHLNVRFRDDAGTWHPEGAITRARRAGTGDHFGSKVMAHWLDDLKRFADRTELSDDGFLRHLFGDRFATIHLYREDSVAAAVSFTIAEFSDEWHRESGAAAREYELPRWDVLSSLITDNVAWFDWCKNRLRRVASALAPDVIEMSYEELAHDPSGELARAVDLITGGRAKAHRLVAASGLRKQGDERSAEICRRWRAEHGSYAAYG
ncbi:Stf0 family sulfotransferase [Actinomadura rayongensis]|uniref:Sulphotransferase Stf0 domain-containing protein n=1 Tax=Actinomadura rayongensis TaxID=1429076 RepID=A0A6I4W7V4_9ACTN|nr:Stf0 family sulfotransferase [Actinomadura rayongensis]MXQ65551.1 hypothetical protein [Actinomadura rayongensis]